jgi:predicted SAM-dependent methyltransferase
MNSFERHTDCPLEKAVLFEFGAGWDLPIEFLFFAGGVNRQVIVDLNRLVKKELLNDSIKRIGEMGLKTLDRFPERLIEGDVEQELRENYGIDYRAPWDARNTGLAASSIDMVTSTETLQHIPVPDLSQILAECHRILKPGGLISAAITYDDHYSFSDRHISAYNFLQYSEDAWQLYNPPNHYQNRLRHVEYIRLFKQAGFSLLEEEPRYGSDEELEILGHLRIDTRFRSLSLDELAIHESHLAFKKEAVQTEAPRPKAAQTISVG